MKMAGAGGSDVRSGISYLSKDKLEGLANADLKSKLGDLKSNADSKAGKSGVGSIAPSKVLSKIATSVKLEKIVEESPQ